MNWGFELWDQYENISYHTQKGIDFLDKYGSFIKERCAIETEYATKLRRLVKNHQLKKKDDEDNQFTCLKAFTMMLQEINDLAGQHELIAENMMGCIVKQIALLVKEMREERKRIISDGHKHQLTHNQSLAQLDKAKRYYEKAFKEAEKAQENFHRVDADLNLSRADVEKAKMYLNLKTQTCDTSKTDYAKHLQRTNEVRRLYYNELMPTVFQRFQAMEERRIACLKDFIKVSSVMHQNVIPIINKCLEGIINASKAIDSQQDCNLVIERYKSGNTPPKDIPFEDLSNPRTNSEYSSNHLNYSKPTKSDTFRGTISGAMSKKRVGLFGLFGSNKGSNDDTKDDYSDLPPVQRRKRIQEKIDSIKAQINQQTNYRDGLMKMKVVYEQNNALGDPLTIEGQLTENGQKMEKLQAQLKKFEGYLMECNGSTERSSPSSLRKANNSSVSEDSLSRSASESSVGQKEELSSPSLDKSEINNHEDEKEKSLESDSNYEKINPIPSNGPVEEVDGNSFSYPVVDYIDVEPEEEELENEILPSLGKALALYPFLAQSEGSIPMEEGEEFEVVELDQGDGWTRVRRNKDQEEGFVPTSYLKCDLIEN